MPTVFVFRNVKFVIHAKDHNPPHVHAVSPDAEAKIDLELLECFFSRGYTEKDLKLILKFVRQNRDKLMEVWNEYHS